MVVVVVVVVVVGDGVKRGKRRSRKWKQTSETAWRNEEKKTDEKEKEEKDNAKGQKKSVNHTYQGCAQHGHHRGRFLKTRMDRGRKGKCEEEKEKARVRE